MMRIPARDVTKIPQMSEGSEVQPSYQSLKTLIKGKDHKQKDLTLIEKLQPGNPYKQSQGAIFLQPLVYTRVLDYQEFIGVNRHSDPYAVVDSQGQSGWIKACDDTEPGSTVCWLCDGHFYTHITVNRSVLKQQVKEWSKIEQSTEKCSLKKYPALVVGSYPAVAMIPALMYVGLLCGPEVTRKYVIETMENTQTHDDSQLKDWVSSWHYQC